MVHRDTSLHRSHRREREQSGAVTGSVDTGNRGARDPVDTQVSTLVQLDADPLQAETVGVGDGTDGHQSVASFDRAAVGELDDDALLGALDGVRAGVLDEGDTALGEGVLEHERRIGILAGQNTVATGHERDLDAHLGVRGDELGTGDTGTDHDQVLGKLVQVVELAPRHDSLTVGLGSRDDAGAGAGGDQHDVCVDGLLLAASERRANLVCCHAEERIGQFGGAGENLDAYRLQPCANVRGLGQRETLDSGVDLRQ